MHGMDNDAMNGIVFPVGDRNIFYAPVAAVAAMFAVAAAGWLWLPRADVPLPLVEGCRLDHEVCGAALPDGGRLELAFEPRPIPKAGPMRVSLRVEGAQPASVDIDFQGVEMNMGVHRIALAAAAGGRYSGETTLPVCVTGRMLWQATVLLEVGRKNVSVPFRFESGG